MRLLIALLGILVFTAPLNARWKQEYAQVSPEIRQWFEGLVNERGGSCCAQADGFGLQDPDWEITSDEDFPYKVFIEGKWYPVYKDSVVVSTNKMGYAIVWPIKSNGETFIRCFLPGSAA